MSAELRCWLCSGEIPTTERSKTLGDLNVPVHVGCFDRLFETRAPKSWSSDASPAAPRDPADHPRQTSAD
jgi:hypothetical protein